MAALTDDALLGWLHSCCALLGISLTRVEPDLYRAEMAQELLAELDGRRLFPASGGNGLSGTSSEGLATLYWRLARPHAGAPAADAQSAESAAGEPPEAAVESIAPGSERLDRLLWIARRRGALARRAVAPPPNEGAPIEWAQFWLLSFELRYGGRRAPQFRHLAVDLDAETAAVIDAAAVKLDGLPAAAHPPAEVTVDPQGVLDGFDRAYALACDALMEHLAAEDDAWAIEAALEVEKEIAELERHFGAATAAAGAGADLEDLRARRLAEVRARSAPRIQARLVLAAYAVAPLSAIRSIIPAARRRAPAQIPASR